MAQPGQKAGQKRKANADRSFPTSASRKRYKTQDARAIPVQPATAPSKQGDLDVAAFMKAREFEIQALESSMKRAKKGLMTRAFQQLPRHMRRRTASHNVKKIPRRLRRRALREMKEDNTPTVTKRTRIPSRTMRLRLDTAKRISQFNKKSKTVRQRKRDAAAQAGQADPGHDLQRPRVPRLRKNTLADPPMATSKYKRRQVHKTWLPTHLWHTKRAHMTRPTEPLWRMTIPLSPTEKSYRPSHRASGAKGCLAWDTSYLSTVACFGTETSLDGLLRGLWFCPDAPPSFQKKWRAGVRYLTGWVHDRDDENRTVAQVTVLWCVKTKEDPIPPRPSEAGKSDAETADRVQQDDEAKAADATTPMDLDGDEQAPSKTHTRRNRIKLDHRILIRLHPSAFHEFWLVLLKVAKVQKPQVLVEDLRFEIGSIQIQGPGSTESLLGVLQPYLTPNFAADPVATTWTSLAGLNNPGILPLNAILAFDIVDPRLNHPPKAIKLPQDPSNSALNEVVVAWTPDQNQIPSRLFSHKARWTVSNALPSQKAINRRKALTGPGVRPAPTQRDPRIPGVLLASRMEQSSTDHGGNSQGTWAILLPWRAVDPVWRSLMYYPLSSGGTPRFGGLSQLQQMAFEQSMPWFPGDFPGTESGKAWERSESEKRFDNWIRRPPKHRLAWDKLDLGSGRLGEVGRGWTCDWEFLVGSETDADEQVDSQKDEDHPVTAPTLLLTQRQRKAAKAAREASDDHAARRRNTSSPESDADEAVVAAFEDPVVPYCQLNPSEAMSLLKKPSLTTLPSRPALVAIRITLLDKGSPSATARIYRLPTLPKQDSQPSPDDKRAQEPALPTHQPANWSSAPPPAQQPPASSTADSSSLSAEKDAVHDLRARWLALAPAALTPSISMKRIPKQKVNRLGLPRQQWSYPRESLAKVNVIPKNAPQEITEKYGPDSEFGRGDGVLPKKSRPQINDAPDTKTRVARGGRQKPRDKGKGPDANQAKTQEAHSYFDSDDKLPIDPASALAELMIPNPATAPNALKSHPPCPDTHDLIGFVTSGGYNLTEGRGTAVGSIWVQRVVEGWVEAAREGRQDAPAEAPRFLCIVRNAGENVGRLGVWEVCG